jgi:hypothetical protein
MTTAEFLQMYPYAGVDFEHRRLCYSGEMWEVWSLNPVTHAQETLLLKTMNESEAVCLLEHGLFPYAVHASKEGV